MVVQILNSEFPTRIATNTSTNFDSHEGATESCLQKYHAEYGGGVSSEATSTAAEPQGPARKKSYSWLLP